MEQDLKVILIYQLWNPPMVTILNHCSLLIDPSIHQDVIGHKGRNAALQNAGITPDDILCHDFGLKRLIYHCRKGNSSWLERKTAREK